MSLRRESRLEGDRNDYRNVAAVAVLFNLVFDPPAETNHDSAHALREAVAGARGAVTAWIF